MTIGGVDCGERGKPAVIKRGWWISVGYSMAGDISRIDFSKKTREIPLAFNLMTKSTLDSLLAQCESAKPGGILAVVPDAGDDLGIGASGSTNLIFQDISAEFLAGDRWNVLINFRQLTS